jgi:hypothetical protein
VHEEDYGREKAGKNEEGETEEKGGYRDNRRGYYKDDRRGDRGG